MADELLLLRLDPRAIRPRRMTALAAGLDLSACLPDDRPIVLEVGGRARIPTGWALALVVAKVAMVEAQEVDELPPAERGTGGFGSTGR